MGQMGHSILAAALLFAGASLSAQGTSVQDYSASMIKVFRDAEALKKTNPEQAVAMYEEFLKAAPPAGDFDDEDPSVVVASYDLFKNLARMHFDAAMLADSIGRWERAADLFRGAGGLLVMPTEKIKTAFPKFTEGYENEKKRYLEELKVNADEIKALEAKNESDYTNEDYTALEHVLILRNGVKVADDAIGYYADRIERADKDLAFYNNPEQSFAGRTQEKIKMLQDQANKAGGAAKFVESVIFYYQKQLPLYAPTQEDKIAFAYRLTVIAPNSRTAPVLLEWLKGNATEADLKRAIAASRPSKKN